MASNQLPATGTSFHIDFGSGAKGTFTSCAGLNQKVGVVEHKASTQGKAVLQRLPGSLEGGELTLKRALVTGDKEFGDWAKKSASGDTSSRVNGTVTVLDSKGQNVRTFAITNAWVSGYTLGDLTAGGNTLLEETVTLTHEGIKVQ